MSAEIDRAKYLRSELYLQRRERRLLGAGRPTKSALARSLEAAPFRTLVAPRGQNEYLDSGGILALISLSKRKVVK